MFPWLVSLRLAVRSRTLPSATGTWLKPVRLVARATHTVSSLPTHNPSALWLVVVGLASWNWLLMRRVASAQVMTKIEVLRAAGVPLLNEVRIDLLSCSDSIALARCVACVRACVRACSSGWLWLWRARCLAPSSFRALPHSRVRIASPRVASPRPHLLLLRSLCRRESVSAPHSPRSLCVINRRWSSAGSSRAASASWRSPPSSRSAALFLFSLPFF